jgi:hypothetical protein
MCVSLTPVVIGLSRACLLLYVICLKASKWMAAGSWECLLSIALKSFLPIADLPKRKP